MSEMIIVGGGQAGFSISHKLRKLGFKGDINIICAEDSLPYQRPPLSKSFLEGKVPRDRLFFRPKHFYQEKNVKLKLGVSVVKIDRLAREVVCSDGEVFAYKKLFLATGSTPNKFPKKLGGGLKKLYYVRSLNDIDLISSEFKPNKRVLIIGGGYVGLELASIARKKQLDVTIIEVQDRILKRVACSQTARFFQELHEKNGVKIIQGQSIDHLIGKRGIFIGAALENGEELLADFSIVGIGAKPCTDLAESCGLEVSNGVRVDNLCRTSDPDILAAGDCTNFPYGAGRLRLESVCNAIAQAEAAASTALGFKEKYDAKPWFWSDQYDVKLQIAGLSMGYDHIVERKNKTYSIWYFRNKKLIAVDAINDGKAYMVGKKLIELDLSPDQSMLSKPRLDLKSLLKGN